MNDIILIHYARGFIKVNYNKSEVIHMAQCSVSNILLSMCKLEASGNSILLGISCHGRRQFLG